MISSAKIKNSLTTLWKIVRAGYQKTRAIATLFVIVFTLAVIFPYEAKNRLVLAWDAWSDWSDESGMIKVTTPRIYTRERLVNDRFVEVDWITEQLNKTSKKLDENEFGELDSVTQKTEDLLLGSEASPSTPNGQGDSDSSKPNDKSNSKISLSPLAQFERAAEYREALRHRLIGEYLDDSHDIDGNTIYRFDFNAAVLAQPRGNFVAAIQIGISENKDDDLYTENIYRELLEGWRTLISREAATILEDRIRVIESGMHLDVEETLNLHRFINCKLNELVFIEKNDIKELSENKCFREENKDSTTPKPEHILPKNREIITQLKEYLVQVYRAFYTKQVEEKITDAFDAFKKTSTREPAYLQSLKLNIPQPFDITRYQEICNEYRREGGDGFYPLFDGISKLQDSKGQSADGGADGLMLCDPSSFVNFRLYARLDAIDILSRLRDAFVDDKKATKCLQKLVESPDNFFIGVTKNEGKKLDYERLFGNVKKHCEEYNFKDHSEKEFIHPSLSERERRRRNITKFVMTVLMHKVPIISPHVYVDGETKKPYKLSHYFDFNIEGCFPQKCSIRVGVKTETNNENLAETLQTELGTKAYVQTYRVVPEKIWKSGKLSTDDRSQAIFNSLGFDVNAEKQSSRQSIEDFNQVIGFADWGNKSNKSELVQDKAETKFGWLFLPHPENVKTTQPPTPIQEKLTALVSIPSWWRLINFKIQTCWLPRSALQQNVSTTGLCPEHKNSNTDAKNDEKELESVGIIKLPGTSVDISRSLRYLVLESPRILSGKEIVEVGRKAILTIEGSRLWKNPRVKLGRQWANKIEVLPNMMGLNATFKCIKPNPGGSGEDQEPNNNSSNQPRDSEPPPPVQSVLKIWTSEGSTNEIPVTVMPFSKRLGKELDTPCWIKKEDAIRGVVE